MVVRRVFSSQLARRITYAVVFEILAVGFTTVILALLGNDSGPAFIVGVISSTVALTWKDRKSTRLNSSHVANSYAVFCLKKKNITLTKITNSSEYDSDR